MGKSDFFDSSTVSESGNWNVADKFSKVKIMLPLAKCEFYEDLAQFGYESFIDELVNWYSIPMDVVRLKGLTRLIKELLRLCKNTMFAMKKAGSKKQLEDIEKELKDIQKILPVLYKINYSNVKKTKEVRIIPDKFDRVLEKVIDIKSRCEELLI